GRFQLAVVERLQRHLALDHLLFEHDDRGLQAILARRFERDRRALVVERHRRVGALEVEARGELTTGLVDRLANLLQVDLGPHIDRRHQCRSSPVLPRKSKRTGCYCRTGSIPEWPKGTGCKPVALSLRWFESNSAHCRRGPWYWVCRL